MNDLKMSFVVSIIVMLLATALFCWVFTIHLGFGPVYHLAAFLGGLLVIAGLGAVSLKRFNS
jgi:hypothetical protein